MGSRASIKGEVDDGDRGADQHGEGHEEIEVEKTTFCYKLFS